MAARRDGGREARPGTRDTAGSWPGGGAAGGGVGNPLGVAEAGPRRCGRARALSCRPYGGDTGPVQPQCLIYKMLLVK